MLFKPPSPQRGRLKFAMPANAGIHNFCASRLNQAAQILHETVNTKFL